VRAVICGAGIAGLTLAWWLERDGWQVLLVEHAAGPRDAGYMIDFVGSGYDVAERMELLPRLRDIQTVNTVVRYVDPAGRGRGWLNYDGFTAALDGRAFTFMRGDLERVLYDVLGDRVPVRYATTVHTVAETASGVEVVLSDGTVERADLLVGADGIHSRVRELAFGPEPPLLRYLGFHTASYLFADDDLRARVGARFLLSAVPGRQVGLYPTNDGRLAVWLTHRSADPGLPSDPHGALLRTYGGMGDLVDLALRHCPSGRDLYYDQVAQIELNGWARGRVTLVGDACQAVSLLAGQGASLGIAGAYLLAEHLAEDLALAGRIDTALTRYEQAMRPVVIEKQQVARSGVRWFLPSTRGQLRVRRTALALARLPVVDRYVAGALIGKSSAVITNLHTTVPGFKPGPRRRPLSRAAPRRRSGRWSGSSR
jgi:2-polyprenyl-6-methoxyphenol hydroxylase-like FAD-dependent oxidoreductase